MPPGGRSGRSTVRAVSPPAGPASLAPGASQAAQLGNLVRLDASQVRGLHRLLGVAADLGGEGKLVDGPHAHVALVVHASHCRMVASVDHSASPAPANFLTRDGACLLAGSVVWAGSGLRSWGSVKRERARR